MATNLHILFESASGYALFKLIEADDIGSQLDYVQESAQEFPKFKSLVKMVGFVPFPSPEIALDNINAISEGQLPAFLKNFLGLNIPNQQQKSKDVGRITIGVAEEKLGSAIQDAFGVHCVKSGVVQELLRGIRLHFHRFVKDFKEGDLEKAQLGLGHSYSRAKVKFNIHRADNMIIQTICLLDQMDKDINTFAMRAREWYSWHFPELVKVVPDNYNYARLVKVIQNKSNPTPDMLQRIIDIVGDETKAQEVLDTAKTSMGTDISDLDMISIQQFTDRVIHLFEYRVKLHAYLVKKMSDVAPNVSTLIGELVGARLIAHAGSLMNLAKYPASTVQILGAEKALFRALKTRGNTPKYGLIFHSTFIGKASSKNKGRISRYLANKTSMASRIDCFGETPTTVFGEKLRQQVEDRLKFYETGETPKKNIVVMKEALKELEKEKAKATKKRKKEKQEKKAQVEDEDEAEVEKPKKKKKKKSG